MIRLSSGFSIVYIEKWAKKTANPAIRGGCSGIFFAVRRAARLLQAQVAADGAQFVELPEVHGAVENAEYAQRKQHPFCRVVAQKAHLAAQGLVDEKQDQEHEREHDGEVVEYAYHER
jgi:hypothetical protein